MPGAQRVDVAMNVFGKPYQTALSILSLLRFSDRYIDRVYFQFEPQGSMFDPALPYVVAEYLGNRAICYQPRYWLHLDGADPSRFDDPEYRLSLRYQHAFETTDKEYLFIIHNDVLIKRDIIGAMLERVEGAFAIGRLGQCWNCPARVDSLARASGCGAQGCTPDSFQEFRPDFDALCTLYALARDQGLFVRPYWQGWEADYSALAWPLPECRVNEWGCLVDVRQTRPLVEPYGRIWPFGAYQSCGTICLDIAVPWFRELHRLGLHARHFDIEPYLTHWVGNGKMTERRYTGAEDNARQILDKHFPDFVRWCRKRDNGLFV